MRRLVLTPEPSRYLAMLAGAGGGTGGYHLTVVSHSDTPVLSSANPVGQGHSDCLIFNPSWIDGPGLRQAGGLVRECCGNGCYGHGLELTEGPKAERISFAPCNLTTGRCGDAVKAFDLDPNVDAEDPRAFLADGFYYLFYYKSPARTHDCSGPQCTVALSRTQTPLNATSWEHIATLPWHRNGCCYPQPSGQRTYCMWGEGGPSPFPGLGISWTNDLAKGQFTQTSWSNVGNNTTSPLTSDNKYIVELGAAQNEIKLEAGTHMHELKGAKPGLITFYAAATPGWVAHGNYTVGWLILDRQDPTKIVQRSQEHILIPNKPYETLCNGARDCKYKGERKNVIFASSATHLSSGQGFDDFRLFFGGGDGNVGTAVIRVQSSN